MEHQHNNQVDLDRRFAIIWLDTHISVPENNRVMKREFQANLVEVAAVPPEPHDPINDLICAIREYAAPIEFVVTPQEAVNLIRQRLDLHRVILISSASLGRSVVPLIRENQFNVELYYIFCGHIDAHREWVAQCVGDGLNMQIFNHQAHLLVKLCRDMSQILAETGNGYMRRGRSDTAARYLEYADRLAARAALHDRPRP